MKSKFIRILATAAALISFPGLNFGQAPVMGTANNFVFFTTIGAVTNSGLSHVTGNVGTNSATSTGFGNVNGVMDDNNPASVLCAADLQTAYYSLDTSKATFAFAASPIGNGDTILAGVDSIVGPNITLASTLYLNAKGNANAVFIIKIDGNFATNISSRVMLLNGALACNVFWLVKGTVGLSGNVIRGSILSNAAISVNVGDTLEGRALTINGAITITAGTGVLAYTPLGCSSPILTGPKAPNLASASCYTIFAGIGALSNTPISHSIGDVGNNGGGAITGWTPADVTGTLHLVPDASTIQCDSDVNRAYRYLDSLPYDIELLYPAQFGNNLVLTPHTYIMKAAAIFTDTLYLDAQGDVNGVFVIQIEGGGLTTSTYANVKLINGAQSKNVYWMIQGAVNINNFSVFRGTIIVSAGAFNLVNTSITLDGRALTIDGAITTQGLTAIMPPGCSSGSPLIITQPINDTVCSGSSASFWVSATGTGLTYQWRKGNVNLINGGNISGAKSDSLVINPAKIADTSSFYNVIVSGSSAPSDTSIYVKLVVNTLPIANAGADKGICSGDSAIIGSLAILGVTYNWAPITGLSSNTLAQPEAKPILTTTYTLTVTNAAKGCNNTDTVIVTVNPKPIANAGTAKSVCKKDSVAIGAPSLLGVTYSWLPVAGLSSAISSHPNASPAINTVYTLTASNGGCSNTDTVTVQIKPLPIANAGPDVSICLGDGDTIGTPAIVGNTYSWSPALGLNASSLAQPNASPAITTTYTLTVSGIASTCNSTDTVIVKVVPQPIANTGLDKSICKGDSTTIGGLAVAGVSYDWLPITGLNSSSSSEPDASPAATTTYTLTASNGVCSNKNTVSVTVNNMPVANAGPDKKICTGTNATIGTPAILGDKYTWTPSLGLSSDTIAQPTAGPVTTSTYTLNVTNGGCSNSDSVIVTVNPLPAADAGNNQFLCGGGSVQLGGPAVAGDTYLWTPAFGLNSTTVAQPMASSEVTTLYTVNETDTTTGCFNSNQVTVTVNPAEFYNGISPNGDGINDWWNIPMLNCYPTNTVLIINRWGSEIWSGTNYDNETVKWTGQDMNGINLPDGTYYYIIKYNNTEKRGWVFIKR
ncbi:MAG TPA: ice-binding family protein [Bacteroidia bacterium]|nr:ice-binding family protein [Bacteroidia bacterium]